jgi:hypothetical protein
VRRLVYPAERQRPELAKRLRRPRGEHVAHGAVVTIQGAGHACNMERLGEWDAAAMRFLRERGLLAPAAADSSTSRTAVSS